MSAVLRWTGIAKLISFYRYIAFAGPRTTTGLGLLLILGLAAIHLYLLVTDQALARRVDAPAYLVVYYALLLGAVALAVLGMLTVHKLGWALASLVSAAALLMYIASRMWGLPDLSGLVGSWDYPLGTFLMALAASFLTLHFLVITRMCVAYPEQRKWPELTSKLVWTGGPDATRP